MAGCNNENAYPIDTNLTVGFGDPTADNIPLVITGHQGYIKSGQGIPYRVYPYDNETKYDASYGTVDYESNHEDRVFEVVRFNGGTEAAFSKYPDRIESYELMGKIVAANGDEAAEDGSRGNTGDPVIFINSGSSSITVTYDSVKKTLVSTAPCFAIFKCFYYATYALVRYIPEETSRLGSSFWGRGFNDYTYGTLVAQLGTSYATYDVDPPSVSDVQSTVLYEVWSETIANEAGEWEKPDSNWPSGGTPSYTGGTTDYPDPADGYQENKRLHQSATIDTEGFIRIKDYPVGISAGPTDVNYSPVFVPKKYESQIATDPTFQSAAQSITSVDKSYMDQRLNQFGLDYDSLPE